MVPVTKKEPMSVFLSWSGKQSHQVANSLREWLPTVIPDAVADVPDDIRVGTEWRNRIVHGSNDPIVFVICLTPDNVRSPWLYFESGMIAAKESARVFPLLIGVDYSQLTPGPLSQYQGVLGTKEGTWNLVRFINSSLGKPPDDPVVAKRFSDRWPWLKARFDSVLMSYDPTAKDTAVETEQPARKYDLSDDAQRLIVEAAKSKDAVVLMIHTSSGIHVQANEKILAGAGERDPRTETHWQSAIRKLVQQGLLEARGSRGEVFGLTSEGFRLADSLTKSQPKPNG